MRKKVSENRVIIAKIETDKDQEDKYKEIVMKNAQMNEELERLDIKKASLEAGIKIQRMEDKSKYWCV